MYVCMYVTVCMNVCMYVFIYTETKCFVRTFLSVAFALYSQSVCMHTDAFSMCMYGELEIF